MQKDRKEVQAIAMDMRRAYINAPVGHLPTMDIVNSRFYIS
ncbi:MAG: transposase [Opitutales bacterium]|nr:transposase [Opitutales bacterium]